jgi:DNA repair ATPase RecN
MKDIQKTYQDLYQNYNLMKKKHQEATNECVQYRFQLERAGQKLKNAYGVQISFDKKMKDMNLRLQSKGEALEQSTQVTAKTKIKRFFCSMNSLFFRTNVQFFCRPLKFGDFRS